MTDVSLLNPGTSLQLESGGDNQYEEEAEYQQEEQQKQKELRELLTNAFDDLEDDILSECSHDGDLSSRIGNKSADTSQHESNPQQAPSPYLGHYNNASQACTSTPIGPSAAQQQQHYFPRHDHHPFLEDTPPDGSAEQWQTQPQSHVTSTDKHYDLPSHGVPRDVGHWDQHQEPQGSWEHGANPGSYDNQELHVTGHLVGRREEAEGGNDTNQNAGTHDQNSPWYRVPRGFYLENYDGMQHPQQQQHPHEIYAAHSNNNDLVLSQQAKYDAANIPHNSLPYSNNPQNFVQQQNQQGYQPSYGVEEPLAYETQSQTHPNEIHAQPHFVPSYQPHDQVHVAYNSQPSHNVPQYLAQSSRDSHESQGYVTPTSHDNVGPQEYLTQTVRETNGSQGYLGQGSRETAPYGAHHLYETNGAPPDYNQSEGDPSLDIYSRTATLNRKGDTDLGGYDESYKVKYANEKRPEAATGNGPFDRAMETEVDHDTPTDGQQLSQLQILYKARGRRLEELTAEFESYKLETSREIRILKHQLSMAHGDREGMENSLKQSQGLLQATKGEVTQLTNKLETSEKQLEAVRDSKEELMKQLTSAEVNIESLNEQIAQMSQSDSLERARAHHQSVVSGIQQKCDREVLSLKEKVDVLQDKLIEKGNELTSLRRQLAEVQHQAELAQISRAETINRLSRSLEESQRQCHSLLESSVTEELGKVKVQLRQATAAKTMSDEMCTALQEELVDLREQLSMFETASSLGAFSVISTSKTKELHNDSMADLGIKKTLDFKTPESASRSEIPEVSDDYVTKLKMELERCLMSNKTKRAAVTSLQTELRAAKTELSDVTERCERAEKTVKELETKLQDYDVNGEGDNVVEKRLRKDVENLKTEKDGLIAEIQELKHRLEEVASNEEKVNEINRELSSEISQMVRDYDDDKRDGMQKCHEAYMQMVEDAKTRVREEMGTATEKEKSELVEKYESELLIVREELRGAWKEVDNAKELYIQLSEEKTQLEKSLKAELESLQAELTSKLSIEKAAAFEEARRELEESKETVLKEARDRWLDEQESLVGERIQTEVEKAKSDWLSEYANSNQDQIDSAVQAAEVEWKSRHQVEVDKELEARIAKAKEEFLSERTISFELEVKTRLDEEKKKWMENLENTSEKLQNNGSEEERSKLLEEIEQLKQAGREKEEKFAKEVAKLNEELEALTSDYKKLSEEKSKLEEDLKKEIEKLNEKSTIAEDLKNERTKIEENLKEEIEKMKAEMGQFLLERQKSEENSHAKIHKLQQEISKLVKEKEMLTETAKEDLEEKVKAVVKEAEEKFRSELEKTISLDKERSAVSEAAVKQRIEEEVSSALSAARADWQKEEDVTRATAVHEARETVHAEVEARYQGEVTVLKEESERLRTTLGKCQTDLVNQRVKWQEEREAIVREKDTERRECLQEIQAQCERDIQRFMADHEHTLTSALRGARDQQARDKERFEEEIKQLKSREQQLLGSLRSTPNTSDTSESGRTPREGETTCHQSSSNCDNCEYLEKELKSLKDLDNLEQLREEKEKLKDKVSRYNGQVKKLLQDRQKLQMSLENLHKRQRLEEQHEQLRGQQASSSDDSVNSSNSDPTENGPNRQGQLISQVRRLEALLKENDTKRKLQLEELRGALETEHSVAMETMKKKMVELRKTHSAEVEKLRRKFSEEKQELSETVEKLRSASRRMTSTPVQTEASEDEKNAILEVRAHYIEAVTKIREDVMKHVTETNIRAAEKIKEEMAKGRSSLVLEIKTTCLQVIRNVLERSKIGVSSASVVKAVERQLETLAVELAKGRRLRKTSVTENSDGSDNQTLPKSQHRADKSHRTVRLERQDSSGSSTDGRKTVSKSGSSCVDLTKNGGKDFSGVVINEHYTELGSHERPNNGNVDTVSDVAGDPVDGNQLCKHGGSSGHGIERDVYSYHGNNRSAAVDGSQLHKHGGSSGHGIERDVYSYHGNDRGAAHANDSPSVQNFVDVELNSCLTNDSLNFSDSVYVPLVAQDATKFNNTEYQKSVMSNGSMQRTDQSCESGVSDWSGSSGRGSRRDLGSAFEKSQRTRSCSPALSSLQNVQTLVPTKHDQQNVQTTGVSKDKRFANYEGFSDQRQLHGSRGVSNFEDISVSSRFKDSKQNGTRQDVAGSKMTPSLGKLEGMSYGSLPTVLQERKNNLTRYKSLGDNGPTSDSGLGSMDRPAAQRGRTLPKPKEFERTKTWSGTSTSAKHASAFGFQSAPSLQSFTGHAGNPGTSSDSEFRKPQLFRQSSENGLASSVLTQYSGRNSFGSAGNFDPLVSDTDATLNSLGLGQRSPRKYNPVPEKPDSEQPRSGRERVAAKDSWKHPIDLPQQTPFQRKGFQPSTTSTEKKQSLPKSFTKVPPALESSDQGRESVISDISYNLHLSTNSFDSSIQHGQNQLGQSFVPVADRPRMAGSRSEVELSDAVRRPVPVNPRRSKESESSLTNQRK